MQCSVGICLDESCENQSYGISQIQPISEFEDSHVILLKRVQCEEISNLCTYHFQKYVVRYRHLFGVACCDPLAYHKKIIKKQLREITVDLCDKWPSLCLIPGKSLCCTCLKKLSSEMEDQNMEEQNIEDEVPFTVPEVVITEINAAGNLLGVTPVKIMKLADGRKHKEVKRTMDKFATAVQRKLSESFDIQDIQPEDDAVSKDHQIALADIDFLVESIKDRLKLCNSNFEKMQVISVVPHSWSIAKTVKELGVSVHLVRKAQSLVEAHGIIPQLNIWKCGKKLPQATTDLVTNFYESDEISRMCPGMKDTKSVRLKDGTKQVKQKMLILCNLKEAYEKFKAEHPTIKLGFSKFCMLRPEWCILAGPKGTHSVCVCVIHQNVKLMASSAIQFGKCTDIISKTVCDIANEDCMFGVCANCPGIEALQDDLNTQYEQDMVTYQQWVTTDRCNIAMLVEPYDDFKETFLTKIQDLKIHHFVAKSQSMVLKTKKANLKSEECIIIGDFSENYTFIIQDEIQSYHWVNSQATLHPFCIYYKGENDELSCRSVCFLSDCLNHNTVAVYTFQKNLIPLITSLNSKIEKVIYFSDGSAAQYKNRKNFANLCKHKEDFGLDAEWHFFATSHGKGPCDGIGGTVKRLVAKASLQRTKDPILTVNDMFEFCERSITGIKFFLINGEDISIEERKLTKRFSEARRIPNTRENHRFVPKNGVSLDISRTSANPGKNNFLFKILDEDGMEIKNIKEKDVIACVFGDNWFVARVEAVSEENSDVWVKFYHPSGPSTTFSIKENSEKRRVPLKNVLDKLTSLEFTTLTGRTHNITQAKNTELSLKLLSYLKK